MTRLSLRLHDHSCSLISLVFVFFQPLPSSPDSPPNCQPSAFRPDLPLRPSLCFSFISRCRQTPKTKRRKFPLPLVSTNSGQLLESSHTCHSYILLSKKKLSCYCLHKSLYGASYLIFCLIILIAGIRKLTHLTEARAKRHQGNSECKKNNFNQSTSEDMSFLKHVWGDVERQFWVSISHSGLTFPGLITVHQSQRSIHSIVTSMSLVFSYTACRQLWQMFVAIIFFHGSEYILAVGIHGKSNVTLKSLLISKNYLVAMIFSLLEYLIEYILFPGMKEHWWVSNWGLGMLIIGEIIRKMAIITAGRSFTHLIRVRHSEHHQLITNGIYRVVRHPGYCGFFIWSVGTQIMLCNPISTIAFALVVWRFFAQRIPYEEYFLRQFFGLQYEEYARQVPAGVPFIK